MNTQQLPVVALSLGLLAFQSVALAETSTGLLTSIRFNKGDANSARVSIEIFKASEPPCSLTPGWYAYEESAGDFGKSFTNALLSASGSGHEVTVVGSGTCDAFGVETVSYIDLK